MPEGFSIMLPVPPATNNLYFNVPRKGRVKSQRYREWIEAADAHLIAQRPGSIEGPYEIAISIPKVRGDVDGRMKPILDYLVSRGLTSDDRHCRRASIERDETLTECVVTVRAA